MGKEIGFFRNKCRMCGACLNACKHQAIDLNAENRIDRLICTLCGDCAEVCPYDAYKLFGEIRTCDELMEQVGKDRLFYRKSGGGVTLSGGEPTMQSGFILAFLKKLKQAGIHTAMETNGHFSAAILEELIPHTDLFLYDIKHMNTAKHRRYTGVPNKLILENIYKIAVEFQAEVIMRVPLIPGFNDDDDNMKATARFSKELFEKGSLRGVHLLGFHNMASAKYEALHKKYDYGQIPMYTTEQMEQLTEYFEREHVTVQIGG